MVMRMLGEMATANPSTGSFADYARDALGGWAGFSVGWLYWYFWVIVVGFEAVAGAKILTYWFRRAAVAAVAGPDGADDGDQPVLGVARSVSSSSGSPASRSPRSSSFLALGTLFVLGLWPDKSIGLLATCTAHGGFFPNGVGAIFAGIVVVIFSMVGAEIATIAAAESHDPEQAIAKATNSVIVRIAIFFVGSIFLLAVILPWNSTELGASPYVARVQGDGHPVRRPHHERGRADRGAVLPELRALHRVADAVRAGRPAGGADRG